MNRQGMMVYREVKQPMNQEYVQDSAYHNQEEPAYHILGEAYHILEGAYHILGEAYHILEEAYHILGEA